MRIRPLLTCALLLLLTACAAFGPRQDRAAEKKSPAPPVFSGIRQSPDAVVTARGRFEVIREDAESVVRWTDAAGALVAEQRIEAEPLAFFALPDGRLAFVGLQIRPYPFGVGYDGALWTLDFKQPPLRTPLTGTTLKKSTPLLFPSGLADSLRVAVSPTRDEILYTRLHDPPAFPPYFAIVRFHIPTGVQQLHFQSRIEPFELGYSRDAEGFYLRSPGARLTFDLWTGEEIRQDEEPAAVADSEALRRLRSWRMEGLIDAGEYRLQKERISNP